MRKLIISLILILIASLSLSNTIFAEENNDVEKDLGESVANALDEIDFDEFDRFMSENLVDIDLVNSTFREYIEGIISGKFNVGFGEVLNISMRYIMRDVLTFLPLIIIVLSVSILFSIVDGMTSKFTSRGTTEIIYFVCYIVVIVSVVTSLSLVMKGAIESTRKMNNFMHIIFPVLLTLMASLGGAVSVSTYQPFMLILSGTVSSIISKLVIPIFIATIVFSIVGNLSSNIKLEKMTKSIKSVGVFVLTMVFSLFSTFVTMQGITGSAIDSVSIKSAKFAISSYVPILGGYLSDGFDLTMASIVLIKNAVGFVGIIIILLLALVPVIKMAIFTLILKLTAGIIEPICDARISSFVYGVSENMSLLIAVVLGVAFMFFIMCMLVILTLNVVI